MIRTHTLLSPPAPDLAADAGRAMQDALLLCRQLYVFFQEFLLLFAAFILLFPWKARHIAEP